MLPQIIDPSVAGRRRAVGRVGRPSAEMIDLVDQDAGEHGPDRSGPIRSISRAISVLQSINRGQSLSMMEIAKASAIPYPTACRIVQTLLHEGMIERESSRKRYQPTAMVQTLAHGFQGHGPLIHATRPHIAALTRKIGWPISLTTHVGSAMVIRDSTHGQTSLTFNTYFPGYAMPILECAAGLVYLAFTDAVERDTILNSLAHRTNDESRHMLEFAREGEMLGTIRGSGYAARGFNRFTQNPGKTSSIAVPLFEDGIVAGALTLAFFASSMKINDAIKKFLPALKACAAATSADLGTNGSAAGAQISLRTAANARG